MKIEQLNQISNEINRFLKAVDEAIVRANSETEFVNPIWGISGTRESGAVKRKYLDMKYEINKILK